MSNIDKMYTSDPAEFAASYFNYLQTVISRIDVQSVAEFVRTLLAARDAGSTVYFIGNGGSAATASHFANDIAIGTNDYVQPFRVVSLTDNVAILTAIGNDFGYDEVFVRQLKILGRPGDVLVGISASGNSPNLINAFDYARTIGIRTVALTAFDGGRMKAMADVNVHVPTGPKEYGPAEDAHMIIDHLVGGYLSRYVKHAAGA